MIKGTLDFGDVPRSLNMSLWGSLEREHLGMKLYADLMGPLLTRGVYSEVYKARSKANGAILALKKILMHNEKDGVS